MIYRDQYTKQLQSKQLEKSQVYQPTRSEREKRRQTEREMEKFCLNVKKVIDDVDWWDCVSVDEKHSLYVSWLHCKIKSKVDGNKPNLQRFIQTKKDEIKIDISLYRDKKLKKLGI